MQGVVAIFVASLVGSPHCAAMCGPFLAFAAAGDGGSPRQWSITAAYHGGRLVSYAALGIAAGSLGAGIEGLGALAGVSRMAAIIAGLVMVTWGVDTILTLRGRRSRLHAPASLQRAVMRVTQRVRTMSGPQRAAVTGLTTALLPCGWLYVFVAAAGATGAPGRAALMMAVFWTGTLPLMAALGLGLQRLAGPVRRTLPLVTASIVVIIGLLTISGRLTGASGSNPHVTQHSAGHR